MSHRTLDRLRRQIRRRLMESKVTQQAFARAVGHSGQWATMVLRGQRGVGLDDIDRIAAYFGVSPTVLLEDPDLDSSLLPDTTTQPGAHRAAKSDARLASHAHARIVQHRALIARQQTIIEHQQRVIDDALSHLKPLTRALESIASLELPGSAPGGPLERVGGDSTRRPRTAGGRGR